MAGPPPTLGSMLPGTVKAWIEDRGMGFIKSDLGGDDLFIHRSDLTDGNALIIGSPVMFEDAWDAAKSKRVAKKVTGAVQAEGKGAAPLLAGGGGGGGKGHNPPSGIPPATLGQMLTGTVKSWYDEKGMGFVSPDVGGDDCFVHRSFLLDGQFLVVGSQVSFEDSWDQQKSKRIAKNVQGAQSNQAQPGAVGAVAQAQVQQMQGMDPAMMQMMGMQGMAMQGMQGMTMQGMDPTLGAALGLQMAGMDPMMQAAMAGGVVGQPPPPMGAPPAGLMPIPEGMKTGTVKAWIEARGMGFIKPDTGEADVFVHRSCLTDCQFLTIGAPVQFEEGMDVAKGKMIAKKVITVGVAPAGGVPQMMGAQVATGNMQTGTVKAWIDDRGMGFITPHAGGDDLFIHRSDLVDGQWLVVGSQVTFEECFDQSKNKRIAKKCSGAASAMGKGAGMAMASGGMQGGTVKMWFNEKAFGFIIPDGGGDDVMVHKNEIAEGLQMVQGLQVKFEASWDPMKNKFKATRCVSASDPTAAFSTAQMGGKGGAQGPQDNLFIAGLPLDTTEDTLRSIFGQYGAIASCKVLPANGKPDAAAMLRMADPTMATWIVDHLNGNIPVGLTTPISCRYAQSKAAGGYGKAAGKGQDNRSTPYGDAGAAAGGVDAMAAAAMAQTAPSGDPLADIAAAELAALVANQNATPPST